jgi:hypothetical protein
MSNQPATQLSPVAFRGVDGETASIRLVQLDEPWRSPDNAILHYEVKAVSKRGVEWLSGGQTGIDAILQLRNGLEELLHGAGVEPGIVDFDFMSLVGLYRSGGSIWIKGTTRVRNCFVLNDTRNFGSPDETFAFIITPEELSNVIDQLSGMVRYIEHWKKRHRESWKS